MNRKTEEHIESPGEKLIEDLKSVVHDGQELLRAGAQELGERGSEARERLSDALESAKDMGRKLQKQTINGAKATDRVIRENPYQSLAIAFGLGLLLGIVINRRNRS
jgi:ElaB/YqjD/DUF883 family membrane-anchored ribosome-binding protein